MNEVPQEDPKATRFTADERRMLRMLTMLPAPYRDVADDDTAKEARRFWYTMSGHLGTVRKPSGAIAVPAVHAGALMEEGLAGVRRAAEATAASLEDDSDFTLRLRTKRLAHFTFLIFGDPNDHQYMALCEALKTSRPQAPKGFTDEWLRQLREVAMNVVVDNIPIEWEGTSEFGYLDRSWGRPDMDESGFFPRDIEGFGDAP